jgi:uncharacterized membrane protein
MTMNLARATAIGLAIAAATPGLAQTAPAAPPAPPAGMMMHGGHGGGHGGRGGHGMMDMRAFPSMSEAGRKTMSEAMRAGGDRKVEREAVKAARDRMLAILDADRLDTAALKRAMEDERNAANANRERHQAAMITAFGKLSVADRKAFVADSRAMKTRMESRMKQWRGKRMMHGGGETPPPSPM